MESFKVGDVVKFLGCPEDNEVSKIFFVGDKYYVEKIERNQLTLRGICGRFNLSMFEKV